MSSILAGRLSTSVFVELSGCDTLGSFLTVVCTICQR